MAPWPLLGKQLLGMQDIPQHIPPSKAMAKGTNVLIVCTDA
jgi:hypothetical protein